MNTYCMNCGQPATEGIDNLRLCASCFAGLRSALINRGQDVYDEALKQQAFEIRVWKEAFGQGFSMGFEAGRDIDLEKN